MHKLHRDEEIVDVTRRELRALVFWSASGVRMYKSGSYRHVQQVVNKYRSVLSMLTKFTRPEWGADRLNFDMNQFKEITDHYVEDAFDKAADLFLELKKDGMSDEMIAHSIRALKNVSPSTPEQLR